MILLFGPTGAGKSMQGQMLAVRQGWKWLSTGEMLRKSTDPAVIDTLKKGELVSDALTYQVFEKAVQEAREKQAQILKEAADTRDAIVGKAQEKAKDEGTRLINEAKAEIENEKQNAIRDIRSQVAQLSVQIAEKILREKLSSNDKQMEMIDRLLDEVSSENDKG